MRFMINGSDHEHLSLTMEFSHYWNNNSDANEFDSKRNHGVFGFEFDSNFNCMFQIRIQFCLGNDCMISILKKNYNEVIICSYINYRI